MASLLEPAWTWLEGESVGMLSGSTRRVNGGTRLSFTILLLTSFFPRQVDGPD